MVALIRIIVIETICCFACQDILKRQEHLKQFAPEMTLASFECSPLPGKERNDRPKHIWYHKAVQMFRLGRSPPLNAIAPHTAQTMRTHSGCQGSLLPPCVAHFTLATICMEPRNTSWHVSSYGLLWGVPRLQQGCKSVFFYKSCASSPHLLFFLSISVEHLLHSSPLPTYSSLDIFIHSSLCPHALHITPSIHCDLLTLLSQDVFSTSSHLLIIFLWYALDTKLTAFTVIFFPEDRHSIYLVRKTNLFKMSPPKSSGGAHASSRGKNKKLRDEFRPTAYRQSMSPFNVDQAFVAYHRYEYHGRPLCKEEVCGTIGVSYSKEPPDVRSMDGLFICFDDPNHPLTIKHNARTEGNLGELRKIVNNNFEVHLDSDEEAADRATQLGG